MIWQGWVTAILGIWVAIVPYLNFSSSTQTIVLVVSGIVLLIVGVWDAITFNSRCQIQS